MKRSQWGWAVVLLLVFLISGCAVNQKKDVQIYRNVLDSGKSASNVSFHPEAPLALKDALVLANAHNERLAMAGEDYLQALINKDRAFAAFLPTISFAPSFMNQGKTAIAAGNPLIAEFVPTHTMDVPISGNMDLHPFRDVPGLWSAEYAAKMQRALLLEHQSELMLDVAKTYFQVMHSEKQVDVLKYSIKVGRQRLADVRVKEKAGVARPVDVALTEAQLARTQNELIRAKNDVRNSRAMLAFLIGVPKVEGPLTGGLTIPSNSWRIDPLLKMADAHRQDLQAAHEQVKAAASALEKAWGEYFPSVSLNLMYYLSRDSFPNDVDWTSLIRVNVPLFSAGLIHADVRTAYSRLRQARLGEMRVRRLVGKDLRVALDNLSGDAQQIDQLKVQVKAAQEAVRQANAEFDAGLGNNLARLIAEDDLLSAQLNLSTAKFNRNVDYLNLLRVTGVLNPELSITLSSAESDSHETKNE